MAGKRIIITRPYAKLESRIKDMLQAESVVVHSFDGQLWTTIEAKGEMAVCGIIRHGSEIELLEVDRWKIGRESKNDIRTSED